MQRLWYSVCVWGGVVDVGTHVPFVEGGVISIVRVRLGRVMVGCPAWAMDRTSC